jgi:hypothetical protein
MQGFQRVHARRVWRVWHGWVALCGLLCLSVAGLLHAQQQQGNVMPKSNASNNAEVTASFSPQGEASDVQQLVLRFSRDMVRLGEGDSAASPATLLCTPAQSQLKGRWIDTTRYAWEAPQPLSVGVRCEVALRSGLKSKRWAVETINGRAEAGGAMALSGRANHGIASVLLAGECPGRSR